VLVRSKYKSQQLDMATTCAENRHRNCAALHDFHVYLAEVADLVLQKRKQDRIQNDNQNSNRDNSEDFSDEIVKGPLKFHLVSLSPEDIESCPYTPVFAQRMLDWFQKLEWPDESICVF